MPVTLTDLFGQSETPVVETRDSATRVVKGFKVFRSGSFKDSAGVDRKWSVADLRKMAANFYTLRDNGTFPNVPVRENHSRDIRNVVGYFLDVRVEGRYLVADIEFTEPDAYQRYDRGTYRARSAEVGGYEDNSGQTFYPCLLGVAFCDIPAVEGLYEQAITAYSASAEKVHVLHAAPAKKPNTATTDDSFATVGDGLKDILLDLHKVKDLAAGDPDTESALQQVVDAVNLLIEDMQSDTPSDDGSTGSDANSQTGKHSAHRPGENSPPNTRLSEDSVETIKFTLGTSEIEIPEAAKPVLDQHVQQFAALASERDTLRTEVETLKASAQESAYAARDAKVDSWVSAAKIAPAQKDAQVAFCRTLTDDQFTAHSAMVEASPALSITAPVGTGAPGTEGGTDDKTKQIANHTQTVTMLKQAGVTGDRLKASKSYTALVALGVTPEV